MRWLPADPLWRFITLSLLSLPLWFVAWFNAADLLLWPAIMGSGALLNSLHPDLVQSFEGSSRALDVVTSIRVARPEGVAQLLIEVNVLSYAWNMPVLFALLFATDQRFFSYRQLLIAYGGLMPLYIWGISFNVLKTLALQSGPEARQALGYSGMELELIGLGYQFGYLMLPVIGAVALWVGMNREMLLLLLGRLAPAPRQAEAEAPGSPLLRREAAKRGKPTAD